MLDTSLPFAVVFPGQGSQKSGMLAGIYKESAIVRSTYEEASDCLGFDLAKLILEKDYSDQLNLTENTQPALLAVSVALWRLWSERGSVEPSFIAGHSLGEFSALVCAESMRLDQTLVLVRNRGLYMRDSAPSDGAMAAVIGIEYSLLLDVCNKVANESGNILEPANLNAPGQIVIAGTKSSIEKATPLLINAGARKVIPINMSVPSHCSLMKPAADNLAKDLKDIDIMQPKYPVIQNVSAEITTDTDVIKNNLVKQLYSPVQWIETVMYLTKVGVRRVFECGPGSTLCGLGKRINKDISYQPIDSEDTIANFISNK